LHAGTPPDAALDADSETHPALIAAAGGGSFEAAICRRFRDQLVDQVDVVDLLLANA
jgi:hypothetical protein